MSDHPTPEEVRASIVPKSDQLNADDLITGPITVTITKVSRGETEQQPIAIELEDYRPYKPCKTMRRILVATFGEDPAGWIGQRMTLYCDPNVMWGGVKVGGIRISHLSGLSEAHTFVVTASRRNRTPVTVQPLKADSPEDEFVEHAKQQIADAMSVEALAKYGDELRSASPEQRGAIRTAYAERLAALKDEAGEC